MSWKVKIPRTLLYFSPRSHFYGIYKYSHINVAAADPQSDSSPCALGEKCDPAFDHDTCPDEINQNAAAHRTKTKPASLERLRQRDEPWTEWKQWVRKGNFTICFSEGLRLSFFFLKPFLLWRGRVLWIVVMLDAEIHLHLQQVCSHKHILIFGAIYYYYYDAATAILYSSHVGSLVIS